MSRLANRLHRMHSPVVELDTLTDANWARSDDNQTLAFDLLLGWNMIDAQLSTATFVGRIVVGCDRSKFSCTGIDHAEARMDGQFVSTMHHINLCSSLRQSIPSTRRESGKRIGDVGICEAKAFPSPHLGFSNLSRVTVSRDDFSLHVSDLLESVKEPSSDVTRTVSDLLDAHAAPEGLDQCTQPSICCHLQPVGENVVG